MSLLSDFNAALPLTPKKLVSWLRTILDKLDNSAGGGHGEYIIDGGLYDTIYNTDVWTDISTIITPDDFMGVYHAIKNNDVIRVFKNQVGTDPAFCLTPVFTSALKATNQEYYKIRLEFFDPHHLTTHQIERVRMDVDYTASSGEMYLCYKSMHTLDMTA